MSDISRWLEKHGLSKYAGSFAEHEIELGDPTELTDKDLTTIGLPLGPRRRFMKAVRAEAKGETYPHNTALGPAIVAERRQLTVMFIDLVGSTEISQRVDPEDLAEVLRLFKETCAASVAAFDGHIASYYGDGIMVFFGFPHAHEDDPERAIRAGLRIIEEIPAIRTHAKLNVRIGIATGLVVVGDLRGEKMFEDGTAMGETPNLAARLQAISDPRFFIGRSLANSTQFRSISALPEKWTFMPSAANDRFVRIAVVHAEYGKRGGIGFKFWPLIAAKRSGRVAWAYYCGLPMQNDTFGIFPSAYR